MQKLKIKIGLVIFFLICTIFFAKSTQAQSSHTYYVSTLGNDSNSGTIDKPWKTIQKAANTIGAGDTVFVRGGTYSESIKPTKSGADGNYITYSGYGDEQVVVNSATFPLNITGAVAYLKFTKMSFILTASGDITAPIMIANSGSAAPHDIFLDNLVLSGDANIIANRQYGLYVKAEKAIIRNITIQNSQIKNNDRIGIFLRGMVYDAKILNNTITNTGWGTEGIGNMHYCMGIEIHPVETAADGASQATGANGITIIGNDISYSGMQGIRPAFCQNILIKGNTIHQSGASGIQVEEGVTNVVLDSNTSYDNTKVFTFETGEWIDAGKNVVVQNNVIHDNEIGFMIQTSENVITRNNVIYSNNRSTADTTQSRGLYVKNDSKYVSIIHNSLYSNCSSSTGDVTFGKATGNVSDVYFKNNVIMNSKCRNDLSVYLTSGYEADYNNYYNGSRTLKFGWKGTDYLSFETYKSPSVSGQDTNSLNQDPLFINAAGGDFSLSKNSPNIDAGGFLTNTTAAGSGTTISVYNSRYFTNGMNLIDGDLITVGSEKSLRVMAVDYGANSITVDRSISWSAGSPVSYDYYGARPDIGAKEYTSTIIPPSPTPTLSIPSPTVFDCKNSRQKGDANCDGVYDVKDYTIWACEFKHGGTCPVPYSAKTADFGTPDNVIDLQDYEMWRSNTTFASP